MFARSAAPPSRAEAEDAPRTLGDLPEHAARLAPRRVAVVTPEGRWTFQDLCADLLDVARGLIRIGLAPGERSAILLPNGIHYLRAFYGAACAGIVSVPVNTFLAPAEVVSILNDSGAAALVTTRRRLAALAPHLSRLPSLRRLIVVPGEEGPAAALPPWALEVRWESVLEGGAAALPPPPRSGQMAVLTYTSGTTGRIKGVMLSHSNLLANARSCIEAVKVNEKDRLLLFLPMFHSLTQTVCMVTPLLAALTVIILPGVDRAAIGAALRRYRPTIFLAVPAIYAAMAERRPGFVARRLNSVRLYLCGGAPLTVEVLRRFERGWRRPLCEGYGLSEASPAVCLSPVDGERRGGSVGPAMPGVEVRLVREDGSEAAVGDIGEVLVRGANVMIGYYQRPGETAGVLRDGWLHTGDLGRLDGDGYLYLVGRRKEMLIFRGMNIYPREVEEVLAAHPAVAEAAVVGLGDQQRGEVPHAAVALRPGASVSDQELRAYCRERLARYKVPRSILMMAALPRNATGKIRKERIRQSIEAVRPSVAITPQEDPDSQGT